MTQQLRYDLLGAVKYPNKALNAVEENACIAVLDRYFELRAKLHNQLYKRILTSPKNLTLVVHAAWAGPSHKYQQSHFIRARRLARRLHRIGVNLNCLNRIYLSPFLEHRNGKRFITSRFEKLHNLYPDLKLINSYLKGGYAEAPHAIPEIHNTDYFRIPDGPYIWSSDGVDIFDMNVEREKNIHENAMQFGVWTPNFNGKKDLNDTTPPLQRTAWPTLAKIKAAGKLYNND